MSAKCGYCDGMCGTRTIFGVTPRPCLGHTIGRGPYRAVDTCTGWMGPIRQTAYAAHVDVMGHSGGGEVVRLRRDGLMGRLVNWPYHDTQGTLVTELEGLAWEPAPFYSLDEATVYAATGEVPVVGVGQ